MNNDKIRAIVTGVINEKTVVVFVTRKHKDNAKEYNINEVAELENAGILFNDDAVLGKEMTCEICERLQSGTLKVKILKIHKGATA